MSVRESAETFITAGMTKAQINGAIIMSWRLILVVHVLWAWGLLGFIPGAGSGFAMASDSTRLEFLEGRLFDLKVKQCEAIDQGKSVQVYTIQIQEYSKKYRELTGRSPELPSCAELK